MSDSAASPSPNRLPACFPLFLAVALLHALPRPNPKQPAVNRSRLEGAFALIRDLAPRDLIEAHLVLQIAIMMIQGPHVQGLAAAHQGDLKAFQRFERQGLSMTRCMLRLMDRLREHRREGHAAAEGAPWEYDPAEMEAVWREGIEVEKPVLPEDGIETPVPASDGLVPDVAPVAAEGTPPAMSRQQRRALERMQQKLARRVAVRAAVEARGLVRAA